MIALILGLGTTWEHGRKEFTFIDLDMAYDSGHGERLYTVQQI